ncbi:MAG: RDD family protein [Proteobacteria bacterium]|nr:RDD family protein [Pseudomonadota bacterium]
MAEGLRIREMITPEGVDLRIQIGDAGERLAAFLIDFCIFAVSLFVLQLIFVFSVVGSHDRDGKQAIATVFVLILFLVRNIYFIAFELTPRAATPGKRMLGLRVAARDGGRLTADAIFARNFLRELELFLPLGLVVASGFSKGAAEAWMNVAALVWSGIFLFFPLFNRDRLRAGDLVAGTWVVKTPKRRLLADLAESGVGLTSAYRFTQAQVDAYGVHELHVLEDVLRTRDRSTMAAVASRIRIKIQWALVPGETDPDFLAAYYAALRGRLEQRLLFGKRKKDKFDVG